MANNLEELNMELNELFGKDVDRISLELHGDKLVLVCERWMETVAEVRADSIEEAVEQALKQVK